MGRFSGIIGSKEMVLKVLQGLLRLCRVYYSISALQKLRSQIFSLSAFIANEMYLFHFIEFNGWTLYLGCMTELMKQGCKLLLFSLSLSFFLFIFSLIFFSHFFFPIALTSRQDKSNCLASHCRVFMQLI